MSRNDDGELYFGVFLCALVFLGIWIGKSFLEARSYNHVTGRNASTWDAMWLDLGRPGK